MYSGRYMGFREAERECDGGCMGVAGAGGVSGRGPGGGSFVGPQQARISGPTNSADIINPNIRKHSGTKQQHLL